MDIEFSVVKKIFEVNSFLLNSPDSAILEVSTSNNIENTISLDIFLRYYGMNLFSEKTVYIFIRRFTHIHDDLIFISSSEEEEENYKIKWIPIKYQYHRDDVVRVNGRSKLYRVKLFNINHYPTKTIVAANSIESDITDCLKVDAKILYSMFISNLIDSNQKRLQYLLEYVENPN